MVTAQKCYCRANWEIRNNSSNVAEVLNPKCYDSEDRDTFCTRHNLCYCREKRIRPRLFSRPRECIFDEDGGQPTHRLNFESDCSRLKPHNVCGNVKTSSKLRLPPNKTNPNCRDEDKTAQIAVKQKGDTDIGYSYYKYNNYNSDNSSSSPPFKTHTILDETDSDYQKPEKSGNPITNNERRFRESTPLDPLDSRQRKNSHINVGYDERVAPQGRNLRESSSTVDPRTLRQFKDEDFNVNYSKDGITSRNLGEFSSAHQTDLRQREDEAGLQKRGYDTQKRDKNASSEANLKRLSEFRKDHYFDTHSTEDLMKTIPEHRCVHRFGLDNRFLPQPLNADVYGESRCIICDKPMENPLVNKTDERFKKHKVGTFPKFYKYGLAPKKIYVCNDDNVKIEMMLKRAQRENWECPVEKQPNYFNTYALRYQKGVKVV